MAGIEEAAAAQRCRLHLEALEPRLVLDASMLRITELVASNDDGITDVDGDNSDWLEIYQLGRRRGRSVGDASHRQCRQSHQVDDSQRRQSGRRAGTGSCSRRTRTACWPAANCTRISPSPPAASIWRWSTRTARRSSTSTRRIFPPNSKTSPTVGRCRTPAPRRRCSRPAQPRRRSVPRTIALGHHLARGRLQRRGLADLRPDGPRLREQSRRRDQLHQPDRHAAAQRHVHRLHPREVQSHVARRHRPAQAADEIRRRLRGLHQRRAEVAEANAPETLQWDSAASAHSRRRGVDRVSGVRRERGDPLAPRRRKRAGDPRAEPARPAATC